MAITAEGGTNGQWETRHTVGGDNRFRTRITNICVYQNPGTPQCQLALRVPNGLRRRIPGRQVYPKCPCETVGVAMQGHQAPSG